VALQYRVEEKDNGLKSKFRDRIIVRKGEREWTRWLSLCAVVREETAQEYSTAEGYLNRRQPDSLIGRLSRPGALPQCGLPIDSNSCSGHNWARSSLSRSRIFSKHTSDSLVY